MESQYNTTPEQQRWAILVDRVVIGVFVVVSTGIAFAEFDVLPLWARLPALPALAATVLVEITLSNYLLTDIRPVWWGVVALFVYLQSVAIGLLYRLAHDVSL